MSNFPDDYDDPYYQPEFAINYHILAKSPEDLKAQIALIRSEFQLEFPEPRLTREGLYHTMVSTTGGMHDGEALLEYTPATANCVMYVQQAHLNNTKGYLDVGLEIEFRCLNRDAVYEMAHDAAAKQFADYLQPSQERV